MTLCQSTLLACTAFASCAMAQGAPVAFHEALFPLSAIRLTSGPLQRQQELNHRYLLQLEPDRLLSRFRSEAGLEPKAPPYRGWESQPPHLPGHILGFYMSGAALTVQATGDAVLRERLLYIVDELDAIQQANGSGYALALRDGKAVFREIQAGRIDIVGLPWNGHRINGHFEPTYTMNKVLLGLYQIILATESVQARQVFLRLSDWFGEEIVDKLDDGRLQRLLQCEHGSMPETYADAWRLTGDRKYLAWAQRLCHERMLAPLAEGRGDFLSNFHANSNIPKYTGFEHVYQITGDERLHRAAAAAWNDVVDRRSWVVGGNGSDEHFFAPGRFEDVLRSTGPESCNSVNMLRQTEALFVTAPSARAMDFYERVLFNHILSTHEPERGMSVYFTPMYPGAYRVCGDAFDSMWCCTGTGMEAPGKYGQMVYTRSPDNRALSVHLFAPSELIWSARGVTIRQETGFPYEEATTLRLEAPEAGAAFTLRVRHPEWVPDGKLQASLNGEAVAANSVRGSYFSLNRRWRRGDALRIGLPMALRTENLPGSDAYVAFLYGPIVLSGQLGRTGGLTKEDFWQLHDKVPRKIVPEESVPKIVAGKDEDITRLLQPVPGKPLHFQSRGFVPDDVSLIPFFENHFQRYAVYWKRTTPGQIEQARLERERKIREQEALDRLTVDQVVIGDPASEKAHSQQGLRTNTGASAYGAHRDRRWRDARDGGWFSYDLEIGQPPGPRLLRITCWGREMGPRKFNVLVDDLRVASESLGDTGRADFFHREVAIPEDRLKGKQRITVKFQAESGNTAGGVFGLRLLRTDPQ